MFSRKFDTVTGLSLPNNLTSKSPFDVLKLTTLLILVQLNLSFWQYNSNQSYFYNYKLEPKIKPVKKIMFLKNIFFLF